MSKKQSANFTTDETKFRKEWDFSSIPPSERKACFLYEAARESESIRRIAVGMKGYSYTDFSDQSEPSYSEIANCHNFWCAILLANIAPDLDLENISWQNLCREKRPELARLVEGIPCFREVRLSNMSNREYLKEPKPDNPEFWGPDIVAFEINWDTPLKLIEERALKWLRTNPKADNASGMRGRHAREHTKYQDALRRLGALRLWAKHPLKEAMRHAAWNCIPPTWTKMADPLINPHGITPSKVL